MATDRRRVLVWSASLVTLAMTAACSPKTTTGSAGAVPTTVGTARSEGSVAAVPAATSMPVVTVPGSAVPGSSVPGSTAPGSDVLGSTAAGSTASGSTAPPVTSTPVSAASVTVSPADRSTGVSPVAPVQVRAAGGTLRSVTLSSAAGTKVPGVLAADRKSWTVTPELGYGKTYAVAVEAISADGASASSTSSFTTLVPANETAPSAFPIDGTSVGVGQPISVLFDEPITDRAAVQKLITVTTSPKQEGSFRWFSDKEVHWRPKVYWQSGSKVSVAVKIYGRDLGGGVYGQRDKTFAFTVGRSMIAEVDDKTKTMVIKRDGRIIKEMPVSLGQNKYPTYNGVHVVAEKYAEKTMDSSTWGLTGVGAYVTDVKWATRISSTGEFVHAAPWSVASQGVENVSHGCINVSTENAKWFYDNLIRGDIVSVKNTVGPPLQSWDGYGDWQLSYADYQKGSAV